MEEQKLGCLWLGDEPTDYVLCNGDSDLLPTLVKKDEIRYEYNQYANSWSYVSCTVFAAMWMLSDLFNCEFTYDEIKEVDEMTYTTEKYPQRVRWQWYWVKYAVAIAGDWWNEKHPDKQVAYFKISKYDDEIIENALKKLYTLDWNYHPTEAYNKDREDWMIDWTDFWTQTNWHSVDIISKSWQRSVKDSGSRPERNIYWLKNKLSQISNFWPYFYIFVPVNDNLEEIKRLNELKTKVVQVIELNSSIRHLANDENYKNLLHKMNDANRKKLEDIDNELKKYS